MNLNKTFKLELKLSELLDCLNRGKYEVGKFYPMMHFYFSWGKITFYNDRTVIRVNCGGCEELIIFYINENNILLNCDYSVAHPEVPYSAYCRDCIYEMDDYDYIQLEQESYRIMEAYPQ